MPATINLTICPDCGGDLYVIETRHRATESRRRKKCSDCGHILTTREIESSRYLELLAIENRLKIFSNSANDLLKFIDFNPTEKGDKKK